MTANGMRQKIRIVVLRQYYRPPRSAPVSQTLNRKHSSPKQSVISRHRSAAFFASEHGPSRHGLGSTVSVSFGRFRWYFLCLRRLLATRPARGVMRTALVSGLIEILTKNVEVYLLRENVPVTASSHPVQVVLLADRTGFEFPLQFGKRRLAAVDRL